MRGEELLHGGLERTEVGLAVKAGTDDALAIDEEGNGDAVNAAVEVAEVGVAHHDWVVHLELLNEWTDGGNAVVDGNAEHLEALGGVGFLPLNEAGHLDAAGTAPGSPEIEKNDLAAILREVDMRAAEIGAREFRSAAIEEGLLGARWSATGGDDGAESDDAQRE